jgi:hypothetical protein
MPRRRKKQEQRQNQNVQEQPVRKKKQRQRRVQEQVPPIVNDIEEDLRKQRLRQQERLTLKRALPDKQESEETIESPFSASSQKVVTRHLTYKGIASHHDVTSVNSLSLASAYETAICASLYHPRRTRMRQIWHGRFLFESMRVDSKVAGFYGTTRWRDYQVPDGHHCAWDMECKFHVHPSARTFDVAYSGEEDASKLPTIATAVKGGLLTMKTVPGTSGDWISCYRGYVDVCEVVVSLFLLSLYILKLVPLCSFQGAGSCSTI